jgi:hypothetical protein
MQRSNSESQRLGFISTFLSRSKALRSTLWGGATMCQAQVWAACGIED